MKELKIKNMQDFASASGISRPTISRYFNDPDSVRASTKKRIESALDEFDFRPNVYAMNQNRRQTKNIGIVVPYLADPFFAEMARNIEGLIIEAGFHPILLSSHGDPKLEIDNLESLRAIKPAGVLLAPLGRISNKDAIETFSNDISTVIFDNDIEHIGEAFVGTDHLQSFEMMVKYLCETGESPSFFEMKKPTHPNAYKHRDSYIQTMKDLGHEPHLLQVAGKSWDLENIGFEGGAKIISENRLPTNTVLCCNDRLAIGFLSAAYHAGLSVGRGENFALRIAGHDDHPFAKYTCPPLTTVHQDYLKISRASAESLLDIVDLGRNAKQRKSTLFDGKLVIRNSA